MSGLIEIPKARKQLDAIGVQIRNLKSVEDVNEARARVEAVKAWSKVHGHVQTLRLDLLRLEVEALVRIVELGGIDTLKGSQKSAAQWLARLTVDEREAFVAESGQSVTTAAGMVTTVKRMRDLEAQVERGRAWASAPSAPRDADIHEAARHASDLAGAMSRAFEDYGPFERGSFSIEDMAEDVIERMVIDGDMGTDPKFVEGVREVCRKIVRDAPPLDIDGLPVPRFITAPSPEGYVRIPTVNALVQHVSQNVEMKRAQVAQAQAALERLERFEVALLARPGATADSSVGDILAQSVSEMQPAA